MKKKYKSKIFNDPVYGFISVNDEFIMQIIDHPVFQRLRRIKQMGLAHFVYPGAHHTRFHHALGAMHLMHEAIIVLREKGVVITDDEQRGALAAILLHDCGHGPFSHALEGVVIPNFHHEKISLALMNQLNQEFNGALDIAISIFSGKYHKTFLNQLVSGQLDIDRLDYLQRDSFYTGVSEGVIGADRIIKLIDVYENNLVVEEKGVYSIEKFLIARRLMYWQVYLHKTVIAAEMMILKIFKRAKWLTLQGENLFAGNSLSYFLRLKSDDNAFTMEELLENFSKIDDTDIWASIKEWQYHHDVILSDLCKRIMSRRLFKIKLSHEPIPKSIRDRHIEMILERDISHDDLSYYLIEGQVDNTIYNASNNPIKIVQKNGLVADITAVSETIKQLQEIENQKKFYICYPVFEAESFN